ncbi:PLP-dependent aminotransferase family protein [Actinoalloteichus sp. GBA129-24]|uniref:aminotransferase-like domain-containing protein n=1 Tax=Actinoalloteichus sp. GBA129-24 TaxID=1612551 RepID=UPI0009504315|nr:PLP-dependent aminotransferase family protein [Actinoalloteichus sp. GBA129-24]APU21085.1 transcriptional regulator with HTH domain and aminotransferase domain [Actinoalloteichus sp. GBA129-24]
MDPLRLTDLHGSLADPVLAAMEFLNEVAHRYPEAVSFAPGRPYEEFFDVEDLHRYLRTFHRHLVEDQGMDAAGARRTLFQYGRTKGIIHDLIARNLAEDEAVHVDPESIVVTVGAQEAMLLVLRALRADPHDVLLAVSPVYVGITGAARLVEMPVLPVRDGPAGVDLDDLTAAARRARAAGLRPRALYVVPDFANPSGATLDRRLRSELLRVAADEDLLILEDNPYRLFGSTDDRPPTLKALGGDRVVSLGSYAKTGFPGARIGYAVADQPVDVGDGHTIPLADQLSRLKSMITVNTPPIAQAVIGGLLLEHGHSLVKANTREIEVYRRNREQVLDGLAARLPDAHRLGVRWNSPAGGFFIVVTVPFPVDDALLERSAREHRVLWTPMHHFYGDGTAMPHLRLSVSLLTPDEIDLGLDRLAEFITDHARQAGT